MTRVSFELHFRAPLLSPSNCAALCLLAREADPAWNAALISSGLSQAGIMSATASQLADDTSDFYALRLALVDSRVVGLSCTYPAREMAGRRSSSLRHILRVADNPSSLSGPVGTFLKGIPASDGTSFYLARIAIADEWRGCSIGSQLMDKFESDASASGQSTTALHVDATNARALAFYKCRGYTPTHEGTSHIYLTRPTQASS